MSEGGEAGGAHLKFREDIPTKPCSKRCRGPDDVEADTNQKRSYFSRMMMMVDTIMLLILIYFGHSATWVGLC